MLPPPHLFDLLASDSASVSASASDDVVWRLRFCECLPEPQRGSGFWELSQGTAGALLAQESESSPGAKKSGEPLRFSAETLQQSVPGQIRKLAAEAAEAGRGEARNPLSNPLSNRLMYQQALGVSSQLSE